MGVSIGRVLSLSAVVLGIPAACFAGLLFYGKQLADAQVAEGTVLSLEERRARDEEERRRFAAMTPAEHIAAAQGALSIRYDPATHVGGNLDAALVHLDAVPAASPEFAQATALRDEIARRRVAILDVASQRLTWALTAPPHHREPPRPDPTGEHARARIAHRLDRLSPQGLGCVHVEGEGNRTLRFDRGQCSQVELDRIVHAEQRGPLRSVGFDRVRCQNGAGVIELASVAPVPPSTLGAPTAPPGLPPPTQ